MGNDLAGNPDFSDLVRRKLVGNLVSGKLMGKLVGKLVGRFRGECFFWTEIVTEI